MFYQLPVPRLTQGELYFNNLVERIPIVPEETKQAALEVYKTFTPMTDDPAIINLPPEDFNSLS